MSIRITTLGRVQVTRGDAVIAALPSQRLRCALLVYMAVTRDTSRERLLALFWPERADSRARHALSQNIYELRAVLGEDWITVAGEQISVAPHVTVDVLAFGEAADSGDAQTAVSLYRGPFLDGFYVPGASGFEAWLDNQRLRAHRQHRRARRDWISRLVDQARIREAVQVAREWVAIDPVDDEAQHRLIELLADTGDRSGAIGQYEAYTKLLTSEELEPLDETRQLVERIREGDVGALPSPPVPVGALAAPARAPAGPAALPAVPAPAGAAPVSPAPTAPVSATRRAAPPERQVEPRTMMVLAGVLLLALTSFFATRPGPSADTVIDPQRVAVLYFEDRSPDGSGVELGRALTETLIAALREHRPALDVLDRHTIAGFSGSRPDSAVRALATDMLLTGWVTRVDGAVRVNFELLDGSGAVISSDAVTVADGRYLELIDSLAGTVEFVMRQRMGGYVARQRLAAHRPGDAAFGAVVKARELEAQARHLMVPGSLDHARALLLRADSMLAEAERLERRWADPPLARVALADMLGLIEVNRFDTASAHTWLEIAAGHATRVLERQPGHARAYELRGAIRLRQMFTSRNSETSRLIVDQAFADLTRAVELEPTPHGLAQLARHYYTNGNFEMARRTAERASRHDTFHAMHGHILYTHALAEFEVGDDAVAARMCDEGLRRHGGHSFVYCALTVMAWSDSLPADPDRAWAVAAMPHGPPDPMMEMLVAGTLARAGLADSAAAVLDRATGRPSMSSAVRWIEPAVRYRLGQRERAVAQFDGYLAELPRRLGNANMRALAPLRAAYRPPPPMTEDRRTR